MSSVVSCRPGVMPSTKTYTVRRLDSTEQEVTLLKKATGSDCLDRVCRSLGILEKDYFGLRYVDKNGEYLWINLRNPLHEQIVPGTHRTVMEMRVKYFIRPHKILQPVTRLHFYKQLRRDLIQGKLKVNTAVKAARLNALMAQVEGGDFSTSTKYKHKIMCQADNDSMDTRIKREHMKLAGTSFDVAIEKFLEEASLLELYGVELYHVLDNRHVPKIIGVGPESVHIHSVSMEPLKRFSYSSIKYTAFHAKKFTALVSSSKDSAHTEQIDFELKSRASAQALYRTITEFHTFFRRETVTRVVKMAGYCKSLLGNFKGQNPDRFYFDVMKTHREVVDKVWSVLHPSTVNDQDDTSSNVSVSSNGSTSNLSSSRRGSSELPPPLPPPLRNPRNSSSGTVHRSSSAVHDLERSSTQRLPPYTQHSISSEFIRGMNARRSFGNLPHGPHMASTASFNPYQSPSISETDTEDESLYASGGSDCYVSMSTRSDPSYIVSTRSDPGSHRILADRAHDRQRRGQSMGQQSNLSVHTEASGAEMYMTSGDSDISTGSGRINSPPPLYSEVDPEHTVPLEFSFDSSTGSDASTNFVSPIIPIAGDPDSAETLDFDANAVLTRTRELEGELQRLRTAMTCRLCKQNPIGATFCPCGHTVCCFTCAMRLRTCWECDQTVNSVQRMLLTRV